MIERRTRREVLQLAGGLVAGAALSRFTFADEPSAPKEPADVSDVVRDVHVSHKVPGLAGAIVDRSGAVAIGAAGIRKVGAADAMTPGDKVHLGSDTKAMTATLIGRLIEAGKLRLDSTMRDVFPSLAGRMNKEMAAATVAQLLHHTAGVPANVDWWSFDRAGGPLPAQRLKIAKQVLSAPPLRPPGTKYAYSNVGYMLLGAIIEGVRGRAWEDVIRAELFTPLKMTSAGFGPPGTPGKVDQPWGHAQSGNVLEPKQFDNAPPLGPAGRVHCTLADWGKYVAWVLRAWQEDTPILKSDTHRHLITPAHGEEYSGGWITTQRPWGGGTTLTHAGSNTMWYCVAWVAPLKGFAVLAATNAAGDDAAKACDGVAAALIGKQKAMS